MLAALGLAFCVIYVAAIVNGAMNYSQRFSSSNGNQPITIPTTPGTPLAPPVHRTTEPAPQAPAVVRYEVMAKSASSISFGESASSSQETSPGMPWVREVPAAGGIALYSLVAQNGNVNEPISCRITVDGRVLAENTSTGPYAVVNCFGNTDF